MYAQGRIAIFSGLLGLSSAAFGQGGLPVDFYIGGAIGNSVLDVEDGTTEIKGFGSIGGNGVWRSHGSQ